MTLRRSVRSVKSVISHYLHARVRASGLIVHELVGLKGCGRKWQTTDFTYFTYPAGSVAAPQVAA